MIMQDIRLGESLPVGLCLYFFKKMITFVYVNDSGLMYVYEHGVWQLTTLAVIPAGH